MWYLGELYNWPRLSLGALKFIIFNYLGSDVLLSTIYRALETNAKVYKLSGCAETFSLNYLILYLVNNWFVSFNWHYLYLIILHSWYWHSITQLPPHCGGCLASCKVSVAQPVWHNSLRYIKLQVNNTRLFPGRLGFQMDNISYLCFPGRLVIFLQFPYLSLVFCKESSNTDPTND
jgi:hypothetical protein